MNRAGLFKRMAKNRLAPVCAVILCVIVLGALLAPLSPYDPDALSPDKLMGPAPSICWERMTWVAIRLPAPCTAGVCRFWWALPPWPWPW